MSGTDHNVLTLLAKDIADFVNQSFIFEVLVLDLSQLLEQASLFSRECRGSYDSRGNEEITSTASTQSRHALASQPKNRACLSAHRDLQFLFTIESLDHNFSAERRLCEGNRD